MGYVAMKVVRISGRRYMPGEAIDVDLTKSKSLHSLLNHNYVAGYPDEQTPDPELDTLRAKAKELGIANANRMKKETLVAKIAEAKNGGGGDVDLQRQSEQQPEG